VSREPEGRRAGAGTAPAALGGVTRSSIRNAVLALLGAVALVADLRAAPLAAAGAALLFAAVLWILLRRQAEQHRRTRRRRLRRQVGTAALVASGGWVVLALLRALSEGLSDAADAVQAGGQLVDAPWPGAFLVGGLVAIAAVALLVAALVGSRRRHSPPAGSTSVAAVSEGD